MARRSSAMLLVLILLLLAVMFNNNDNVVHAATGGEEDEGSSGMTTTNTDGGGELISLKQLLQNSLDDKATQACLGTLCYSILPRDMIFTCECRDGYCVRNGNSGYCSGSSLPTRPPRPTPFPTAAGTGV